MKEKINIQNITIIILLLVVIVLLVEPKLNTNTVSEKVMKYQPIVQLLMTL